MATKKKPATKKLARKKTTVAATKTKPAAKKEGGKTSALDAAVKVLSDSNEPLTTKQMIGAMAEKGYWKSPGGKTPDRTLYSAILREIVTKRNDSRFTKSERGKFALKR